jgi:formate hydrogenlyase subunit 3/multisubunit Na+/H+ antiporter MnhD subunit
MLPGILLLFALKYLSNNPWLSAFPLVSIVLRYSGVIMIVIGGIWGAFQRHLGRMMAYAVMVEIGLSFLAIDIYRGTNPFNQGEIPFNIFFFTLFISRGLALGTWALGLSTFHEQSPDLRFEQLRGLGRQFPIATSALIIAHFSLSGFPLLAGFPVRLSIIDSLAAVDPLASFWILLGLACLLVGALRTLVVLVTGSNEGPWTVCESRTARFFLLSGIAGLVLAGIFPLF